MADSKAVAARVHPDVHSFLKEEAEDRGTTMGSYVEEILREYYNSHRVPTEEQGEEGFNDAEPERITVEEIEDYEVAGDHALKVHAGSKARADLLRSELSEFVNEAADDRRRTWVMMEPGARSCLHSAGGV